MQRWDPYCNAYRGKELYQAGSYNTHSLHCGLFFWLPSKILNVRTINYTKIKTETHFQP